MISCSASSPIDCKPRHITSVLAIIPPSIACVVFLSLCFGKNTSTSESHVRYTAKPRSKKGTMSTPTGRCSGFVISKNSINTPHVASAWTSFRFCIPFSLSTPHQFRTLGIVYILPVLKHAQGTYAYGRVESFLVSKGDKSAQYKLMYSAYRPRRDWPLSLPVR